MDGESFEELAAFLDSDCDSESMQCEDNSENRVAPGGAGGLEAFLEDSSDDEAPTATEIKSDRARNQQDKPSRNTSTEECASPPTDKDATISERPSSAEPVNTVEAELAAMREKVQRLEAELKAKQAAEEPSEMATAETSRGAQRSTTKVKPESKITKPPSNIAPPKPSRESSASPREPKPTRPTNRSSDHAPAQSFEDALTASSSVVSVGKAACIVRSSQGSKVSGYKIKPDLKTLNVPAKSQSLLEQADEQMRMKDLFGDHEDSGDEDLESGGRQETNLNAAGRDFYLKLREGSAKRNDRVARTTTKEQEAFQLELAKKKARIQRMTDFPSSRSSVAASQKSSSTYEDCWICPVSYMRLNKPLVTKDLMRERVSGREYIRMSHLHKRVSGGADVPGDWVTVGAVVSKTEARRSAKGQLYSMWRLSDLEECDRQVCLFLFATVHEQLCETARGTVVGILNPHVMPAVEKKRDNGEVCLRVENALKVMRMGVSRDLAYCPSRTRRGDTCQTVINKYKTEFCKYHVQKEHKAAMSKRPELSSGLRTAVVPKSLKPQKPQFGQSVVSYEGQAFTSSEKCNNVKAKDSLTITRLDSFAKKKTGGAAASSGKDVKPETEDVSDTFCGWLQGTNAGARNMMRFIETKDKDLQPVGESQDVKPAVSVKPGDLLKAQKQKLEQQKRVKEIGPNKKAFYGLPRAGVRAPVLGRGLEPGQDLELLDPPGKKKRSLEKRTLDANKAKAAMLVSKGAVSIEREDPNAMPGALTPTRKQALAHRVQHAQKGTSKKEAHGEAEEADSSSSEENKPEGKRRRVSGKRRSGEAEDRYEKLLKARSSHEHLAQSALSEQQETYFAQGEKKEKMEDQMANITEIQRVAFTCKECQYTAMKVGDVCKKNRHNIKKHKSIQRFFACRHCKFRAQTVGKSYPDFACTKCGKCSWRKAPMREEKKAPLLPSEILSTRGEETKFLNSLGSDVLPSL